MKTKIYAALVSCLVALAPAADPVAAYAHYDTHKSHKQTARRAGHHAKQKRAKRKANRRAISYVCPMHPDIREKSRGTCPKCLMDLVAEPGKASSVSGAKDKAGGGEAGASAAAGVKEATPGL
jgi:hypothetical protein